MNGRNRARWATALLVGALLLPFMSGCQLGSASLADIVEDLAREADSDRVGSVFVQLEPEGLRVRAAFVEDTSAVQYLKRPWEQHSVHVGSPVPRLPLTGVPLSALDLDGLEQRLRELPDCDDPRGELFAFGGHVAEHIRCEYDGFPTGSLDGEPISPIPAGDLPAAARLLRADAALLDATQVGRVLIAMNDEEVWTEVQVMEPAPASGNDRHCAVFITRARGALYPRCEVEAARFPVGALDEAAIIRIWQAEGEPTSDWRLELVREDDPQWMATSGKDSRLYTLTGNRA